MTITLRLNQEEQQRFNKMKSDTGLSTTELIKKCLFKNPDGSILNANILPELGKISTNINLIKDSMVCEDYTAVKSYIAGIESEVYKIWQSLK